MRPSQISLRSAALFAALTSLSAAACTTADPERDVGFARVGEPERHAALTAALGYPLILGELTVTAIEAMHPNEATCPARVEVPGAVLYDAGAGCTTPTGVRYSGRVRVQRDSVWALRLTFDGFRVQGAQRLALDGTVAREVPGADGRYQTWEDVRFDQGTPVTLEVEATCDASGLCVADPGVGQVAGAGFVVRFERRLTGGVWSGWVELQGQDRLRLELDDARDRDGCFTYRLDDAAAGRWCGAAQ